MNLTSRLSTSLVRRIPDTLKDMSPEELSEFLLKGSDPEEKNPALGRYTFVDILDISSRAFKNLAAEGFAAFALRAETKKVSPTQVKIYAEQLAWKNENKPFKSLKRADRIYLLDRARNTKLEQAPVIVDALPIVIDHASEKILIPTRPAFIFDQVMKRLPTMEDGDRRDKLCVQMTSVRTLFSDIFDNGIFGDRRVISIDSVKTTAWYKLNLTMNGAKTNRELGRIIEKLREDSPDTEVTGVTFSIPGQKEKDLIGVNIKESRGFPLLTVSVPGRAQLGWAVETILLVNDILDAALKDIKKRIDEAQA